MNNKFLTFKEYIVEAAMADIKDYTEVSLLDVKDCFVKGSNNIYVIHKILQFNREWKILKEFDFDKKDTIKTEIDSQNNVIMIINKSGDTTNYTFKLKPTLHVQFDNNDYAIIIQLETSEDYLEVFLDERGYKNLLMGIQLPKDKDED